jgi:glycosyltransferase involved in cell wall biosynthesis
MGHEVKGVCWGQGIEGNIPFVPHQSRGVWKGMLQLSQVHQDQGYTEADIVQAVLREVISIDPDVIIVGNLHGARWPISLLEALGKLDALTVAYMHDCYYISGRCAYPGQCRLYETGCDERCLTADKYPPLDRSKIAEAWQLRRRIFCGRNGLPLATNSRWTLGMAQRNLSNLFYADVVYLGLDEDLFKPIDRLLARRLLRIPDNRFVVLCGAVNLSDKRKGGHLLKQIVSALSKKVLFLMFGAESERLKGVMPTGLIRDYRKMPLLYSAADIFLGTALEEAFGQTLCEAAACELPVVAFNVGGVPEIARHDMNARLVNQFSARGAIDEIGFFMDNTSKRREYGRAGREIVTRQFSLMKQGERWMEYLRKVASLE